MLNVTDLSGLGVGDWTPARLRPEIWIDFADLSTQRQEITGASATTPVAVGDLIGSVFNKGSLGGWLVAPATGNRATSNLYNTRPRALFAGTHQYSLPVSYGSTPSSLWIACVYRWTATGSFPMAGGFVNQTGVTPNFSVYARANASTGKDEAVSDRVTGSVFRSVTNTTDATNQNVLAIVSATTTELKYWRGFSLIGTNSTAQTFLSPVSFEVGHRNSTLRPTGTIAELVAGSTPMTDDIRIPLTRYLALRTGVTL